MEEQDNVYYVYLHRRGDNNEVFYVGKGKGVRATNKTGRNKWWKRVVEKHGFLVEIIESNLCEQNAFDLEIELIKFYRECGHTLCNMTNGGEGKSGTIVSAETRAKLSIARIGNPNCTGHRDSLETRAKKSKSRVGKKHSEETRRKIGQSNKNLYNALTVWCLTDLWTLKSG